MENPWQDGPRSGRTQRFLSAQGPHARFVAERATRPSRGQTWRAELRGIGLEGQIAVLADSRELGLRVNSGLDTPQNRKGDRKTPVEQCLNYVRAKRAETIGNEPVQTWFGLVTDMNEFRLYWWHTAPRQYLHFIIRRSADLFSGDYHLLSDHERARFDRFLFARLPPRYSAVVRRKAAARA
jgi:hypothetical protein